MRQGMDVSRYQGTVDFARAKADGMEFALLRALSSRRSGPYIDPCFERNYAECRRVGLPCGAYYYSYAASRAAADAELALLKTALAGKRFEYPVALDLEDSCLAALSPAALTTLARYALKRLERWGCYACLYSYTCFEETHLELSRLKEFDNWIADYRGERLRLPHGLWQYSSNGRVDGVAGNVDLDRAWRDYPALMQAAGKNGFLPGKNGGWAGLFGESAAGSTGPRAEGGEKIGPAAAAACAPLVSRVVGPMSPGDDAAVLALARQRGLGVKKED